MGERINAANFPVEGDIIRDLRLKLQLSLSELADDSGLSKGYISLIENGRIRVISQDAASGLAEALGVKRERIQSRNRSSTSAMQEPRPLLDSLKSLRSEVRALDRRLTRIIDSADPKKSK